MDWFDNDDEMDQIIFSLYNHSEIFKPSKTSISRIMDGEETILISRLFVQSNEHRNDIFGLSQDMFANHLDFDGRCLIRGNTCKEKKNEN